MYNLKKSYFSKKLFQLSIGITFLFFTHSNCSAQLTDSIVKNDTSIATTIKLKPVTKIHSPRKAGLMSAAIPGLGQIYNKKYWKVPVIYAGFAALAYSFQFNQSRYTKYRDAYKSRIDGDSSTSDEYIGLYSDENLSSLYQFYHRYRDLTVIAGAALYLLNIVDASVDAHLFTFNVDDNLSIRVHPTITNVAGTNSYKQGIGVSINF